MPDQFTGTKSVSWAGAQAPEQEAPQALTEQVGKDISHVPEGHVREHHIEEQEQLAKSHGRGSGERVRVDQPPDVSQLIDASKFSGAPSESKGK